MKTRLPLSPSLLLAALLSSGCGSDSRTPPPSAPTNVAAGGDVQKVTVSWDAVAGATSYDLYWSTSPGVAKATATKVSGLTASPYVHGSLAAGTYYYAVAASGSGGDGSLSAEVSAAVRLVAFASSTVSGANGAKLSLWSGAGGNTGIAAGDAVCQSLATAAGLVGTFRAWLSDGTTDAYCHIQGLTGKKAANCGQATLPAAAGPWVRMDGASWAGTIDTITRSSLDDDVRVPLLYDEQRNTVGATAVYAAVGTDVDGTAVNHCNGFTSNGATDDLAEGTTTAVSWLWTGGSGALCNSYHFRLICMQAGTGPALAPLVPSSARKAFVTSTTGTGDLHSWAGAGTNTGVAAGDAVCQSLATTAGLANATSYKALLGYKTSGTSGPAPADRLTSNGPWERLDGVPIAADKADLGDQSVLTGIHLDEGGHRIVTGFVMVWTGDHLNTGTSGQATCADWSSSAASDGGWQGLGMDAGENWSHFSTSPCDQSYHLYCFED